jgi:hypothetical protein
MIRSVLTASGLLLATAAGATDVAAAQTMWILGYPVTTGGNTTACAIDYNGIGKDYTYKQGNTIALTGSLQIRRDTVDGKLRTYGAFKVSLDDFEGGTRTSARPASIHLVTSDGTIVKGNPALALPSGDPGGLLQVFNLDDNFLKIFVGIIEEKKLIIAFNRTQGGTDLRLPLDLTVKSVDLKTGAIERSDEMVEAFQSCSSLILKD